MDDIKRMLLGNYPRKCGPHAAQLNEFAFKEPLSPLAMYFLGIMFTDGFITNTDRGRVRRQITIGLELTETDREVVEKFCEFLEYKGSIYTQKARINYIKRDNKYINSKGSSKVLIHSDILGKSLIELGVTPNKTFTIIAPDIAINNRDFWRGVFDGDGSLNHNHRGEFCSSLSSASKKFLDQFDKFCFDNNIRTNYSTKRNGTHHQLSIYGKWGISLCDLLYRDCCFAMKRKFDIYKSLKH